VIVVDASAVADALLELGPHADWARDEMLAGGRLAAPHLLDAEVVSVVRRRVLLDELTPRQGLAAVESLAAMRVRRHPTTKLLRRVWELRETLTAYDAAYVALAEALDCDLVTTDARLGRAPGLPVRVRTP
jgi:predicted nucleic acid-binding protein